MLKTECVTADFVPVAIWSGLELYVGVVCACLPSIHSLLSPVLACFNPTRWAGSSVRSPLSGSSGSGSQPGQRQGSNSVWVAKPANAFLHGQRLSDTPPDSRHTSESRIKLTTAVQQQQEVVSEPVAYRHVEVWQLEDIDLGDALKQARSSIKTQAWA